MSKRELNEIVRPLAQLGRRQSVGKVLLDGSGKLPQPVVGSLKISIGARYWVDSDLSTRYQFPQPLDRWAVECWSELVVLPVNIRLFGNQYRGFFLKCCILG